MTRMIEIAVDFDRTFHGTDPLGFREWPPAPARLLAALVAGCHHGVPQAGIPAVRAALRDLERCDAPVIVTGPAVMPDGEWISGFVAAKPSDTRPSVNAKALSRMRDRSSARMAEPVWATSVRYQVIGITDPELLDYAAAGVSYLGTSQDGCTLRVRDQCLLPGDDETRWVAHRDPSGSNRLWYPGLIDALDHRHRAEQDGSWSQTVPDVRARYVPDLARMVDHPGWIPLGFEHRMRETREVRTVLSRLTEEVGDEILPLVNADPTHGDGALLGVAVRGVPNAQRAMVDTTLGLRFDRFDRRSWMRLDRYSGPSVLWRTALPVYAPADRAVAVDYIDVIAQAQGCCVRHVARTGPTTRGCARSTMWTHEAAFVPYVVWVETTTPEQRPNLSTESLMVPAEGIR